MSWHFDRRHTEKLNCWYILWFHASHPSIGPWLSVNHPRPSALVWFIFLRDKKGGGSGPSGLMSPTMPTITFSSHFIPTTVHLHLPQTLQTFLHNHHWHWHPQTIFDHQFHMGLFLCFHMSVFWCFIHWNKYVKKYCSILVTHFSLLTVSKISSWKTNLNNVRHFY